MKGLHGRAGTQMQVVASWYQGWGPEARRSFLSTLVQVASGAGEGDLEAALGSLSLEGADEMLPCQLRLFKGWWREWGHDNRSNFISNFCKVVLGFTKRRMFWFFKYSSAWTRGRGAAAEKWNSGLNKKKTWSKEWNPVCFQSPDKGDEDFGLNLISPSNPPRLHLPNLQMTQAASRVVVVRLGRNPISTITSRNIHLSPALHHQMPKPDPKLVLKRTKNQVRLPPFKDWIFQSSPFN